MDVLKPLVERSERADAPRFARWHRGVGLGFLGLSTLCLAGCAAALSWALRGEDISSSMRLNVALALMLPGLVTGVYFGVVGVRDLLKGSRFSRMEAAGDQPDS